MDAITHTTGNAFNEEIHLFLQTPGSESTAPEEQTLGCLTEKEAWKNPVHLEAMEEDMAQTGGA